MPLPTRLEYEMENQRLQNESADLKKFLAYKKFMLNWRIAQYAAGPIPRFLRPAPTKKAVPDSPARANPKTAAGTADAAGAEMDVYDEAAEVEARKDATAIFGSPQVKPMTRQASLKMATKTIKKGLSTASLASAPRSPLDEDTPLSPPGEPTMDAAESKAPGKEANADVSKFALKAPLRPVGGQTSIPVVGGGAASGAEFEPKMRHHVSLKFGDTAAFEQSGMATLPRPTMTAKPTPGKAGFAEGEDDSLNDLDLANFENAAPAVEPVSAAQATSGKDGQPMTRDEMLLGKANVDETAARVNDIDFSFSFDDNEQGAYDNTAEVREEAAEKYGFNLEDLSDDE